MKNYLMLLVLMSGYFGVNAISHAPDEQAATHSFRIEDIKSKKEAEAFYSKGGRKAHIIEAKDTLGPDSGGEDRIVYE